MHVTFSFFFFLNYEFVFVMLFVNFQRKLDRKIKRRVQLAVICVKKNTREKLYNQRNVS